MTTTPFEVTRGSGNVYADFEMPNPELAQRKARIAATIITSLDARKLNAKTAATLAGVAAGEFPKIRRAHLAGFSVDRLAAIMVGHLRRDASATNFGWRHWCLLALHSKPRTNGKTSARTVSSR